MCCFIPVLPHLFLPTPQVFEQSLLLFFFSAQETPQQCPGPPPPPPPSCPPCRAPSSRSPPTPSPWGRPPRRRRTPAGVGSRTKNKSCGKIRAGSLKYNWVGNFVKLKQPSSLSTVQPRILPWETRPRWGPAIKTPSVHHAYLHLLIG